MITHVVFFKLIDRSPENIRKAKEVLEGLWGNVPELRHLEVGADLLRTERSYDIALVAKFGSLADLDAYQAHPAHVEVVKYMATVRESAVAVDYENA